MSRQLPVHTLYNRMLTQPQSHDTALALVALASGWCFMFVVMSQLMRCIIRFFAIFLVIITVATPFGGSTTPLERYNVYKQLEQALLEGSTASVPNLQVIADAFFPKQGLVPVCVPIRYNLFCNDTSADLPESNHSFLWTQKYIPFTTAALLLSYAKHGIILKGFEWEKSCVFMSEVDIMLQLENCSSEMIDVSLGDMTSELKAFADANSTPKASSSYKGFALNWDHSDQEFHHYDIIFTFHIILLNIFIICSSFVSSNNLYQKLYKNIKGRANPGYSFFWAIVLLSVVWNIGPSWLIVSKPDNYKLYVSLAVLIPLQFVVAVFVKKRIIFPIPGLNNDAGHTMACADNIHSLSNLKAILSCFQCMLSHIIQVLSIWALLITFTFIMHYATSIILSLYLDPLNALVKIVFVKAVLVCFIINVGLLFAVDRVSCECTIKALKQNVGSCLSLLTLLSLFPILFFLVFMIGGIVFNDLPQSGSWKAVFTIIPSATLLYASWFSHGILFPKGITDKGDPAKEIVHDLEGNTSSPTTAGTNSVHTQIEATPLLSHPHNGGQSDSVHSRTAAKTEILGSNENNNA